MLFFDFQIFRQYGRFGVFHKVILRVLLYSLQGFNTVGQLVEKPIIQLFIVCKYLFGRLCLYHFYRYHMSIRLFGIAGSLCQYGTAQKLAAIVPAGRKAAATRNKTLAVSLDVIIFRYLTIFQVSLLYISVVCMRFTVWQRLPPYTGYCRKQ